MLGALRAGAVGFLVNDTSPEKLLRAVRTAADGDPLLSPAITRRLVEAFAAAAPPVPQDTGPVLTARERDVLVLVARGRSNADIAHDLHVGVATVKSYVSRLLTKLDTTTRVGLVVHTYETGDVVPGGRPDDPARRT
ncbi:response regulator transcription factor [Pseudonocardia sp. NPDC046786]|uniref:response regulator transcription factor n=1 Tax=Pseudonocardia sp. NPDC046786 TaxID=3155471 RepID=UPI0033C6EAA0